METKFFLCEHCGNLIAMIQDKGVPVKCCGQNMTELVPNTTDAAGEKHVPVWKQEGNIVTVSVGSVAHPMTAEHSITWIVLQTKEGIQRKNLQPDQSPTVSFALTDGDSVEAVYAYCNLHGLWKA